MTVYAVNEEMTASRGDIRVQTVLEDIIPPVEENPTEELPTAEQPTEEHQTAEQPTEEHQTAEQPTEEQPTAEALQTEEASQTAESTPPVNENPPSTTEKEGFSLTAVILIAVSASIIVGLAAFLLALFINQKKTQVPKE